MSTVSRLAIWVRSVTGRNTLEQQMEDELRFHIEARSEDLQREGFSEREAYRRARIEMGGLATHKDGMRNSFGLRWIDDLNIDLSYALRILRRSPGFTAVAIGSLALAIGANTAIFSFANEMLYERLNVPQPQQLRLVVAHNPRNGVINSSWGNWKGSPDGSGVTDSIAYPVYEALKQSNTTLQDLFAFKDIYRTNVSTDGNALTASVELVSGNFYGQMQVQPELGRPILPSDDTLAATSNVAVISESFWTHALARDTNILGKVISINTVPFTIIGVNPNGFTGAGSVQTSPDLFVPLSVIGRIKGTAPRGVSYLESTELWWVEVMAREKEGVPIPQATSAINLNFSAAVRDIVHPSQYDEIPGRTLHMPTLTLEDASRGVSFMGNKLSQPVHVLLTMTGFILLLACANLANLVLARAATRHREMGVRLALGASRGRLLRQVLTENLLLAGIGGVIGLVAGYFGSTLLPRLTMHAWEITEIHVPFHWPIFAFTAAITIATGVLCGIAPAVAATRTVATPSLRDGGTTATRRSRGLTGRLLVGFQIAISTLLVAGAALFLRSLWKLNHIDPGFQTKNLLLFEVDAPERKYPEPKAVALYLQLEATLRAVPGVLSLTATDVPMLADSSSNSGVEIEGRTQPKEVDGYPHPDRQSLYADVSPTFLHDLVIPVVRGRSFAEQDSATAQHVSVVSPAFVQRFFPHEDPIGKRFRMGTESPWNEIIGISGDIRYSHLREEPPAFHFDLYRQNTRVGTMTYMVRTAGSPMAIIPSLRRGITRIDPDLPMMSIRTQEQQIDDALQQEHIFASLTSGFGLLALALACVGIYGMMAYRVAQRTQEIGVRLPLGAEPRQMRSMILREAGWIAAAGVLSGASAFLILARLVRSMLYGLSPSDPLSLSAAAILLLALAIVSAWIPALRAARMQPLDALRHE